LIMLDKKLQRSYKVKIMPLKLIQIKGFKLYNY